MKKLLNITLIGVLLISSIGQVSAMEGDAVERTLSQRIPGFEKVSKYMQENPRAAALVLGAALTALGAYAAEKTGNYVSLGWNWLTGRQTEVPVVIEKESKNQEWNNKLQDFRDGFAGTNNKEALRSLLDRVVQFSGTLWGAGEIELYNEALELKNQIEEKINQLKQEQAQTSVSVEVIDNQLNSISKRLKEPFNLTEEVLNNLKLKLEAIEKITSKEGLSNELLNKANKLDQQIDDLLQEKQGIFGQATEFVTQKLPTQEAIIEVGKKGFEIAGTGLGLAGKGISAAGSTAWKWTSDYIWPHDPIPYDEDSQFVEISYLDQNSGYFRFPTEEVFVTNNFIEPQLYTVGIHNIEYSSEKAIEIGVSKSTKLYIYDIRNNSINENQDFDLLIWASHTGNKDNEAINFAQKYAKHYETNVKLIGIEGNFLTEIGGGKATSFYDLFSDHLNVNVLSDDLNQANSIHTFGEGTQGAWVKNLLDLHLISYQDGALLNKLYGMQWGVSIAHAGYQKFFQEETDFAQGLPPEFVKRQLNIYGNNVEGTSGQSGRTYKDSNPSILNLTNVKLQKDGYETNMEDLKDFLFVRNGYFQIRSLTDQGGIYYNRDMNQTYNLTIGYHSYNQSDPNSSYFYPTIISSGPDEQEWINMVDDNVTFASLGEDFKKAREIEDETQKEEELNRLSQYRVQLFKLFNYRMGKKIQEMFTYQPGTTGIFGFGQKIKAGITEVVSGLAGESLLPYNAQLQWEK